MADRPVYGTFGNNTPGGYDESRLTERYKEWLRQNAGNMGGGDAGPGAQYQPTQDELNAENTLQNSMKPIMLNGQQYFQLGPSEGGANPYNDRHVDYGKMPQGHGVTYDPTYGWVAPTATFNARRDFTDTMIDRVVPLTVAAIGAGAGAYGAGLLGEGAGAAGSGSSGLWGESLAGPGWAAEGGALPAAEGAAAGAGAGAGPGSSWASGGGFGAGGLAPEEMGAANYAAGAGLPGSSSGLWDRLSSAIGKNPLQAAQFAMGLGSLGQGLLGKPNSGTSDSGSVTGLLGGQLNIAKRGAYQPNQITMDQIKQLYGKGW